MPIATAGNAFLVGLDRQTNEATVSSTANFSMAVYEADVNPVEALNRVEVTDASSIQGDPYKGPQSWAGSFTMPFYSDSGGQILNALWPTDTKTGAGPTYTHTYSGLGGTQSWHALYTEWSNAGPNEYTFGKGQCTGITIAAANDGSPLSLNSTWVGQQWTDADWTVTTADNLDDGYFRLVETGGKIELDLDTPNSNPSAQPEKIRSFSLTVARDMTPEPVVDSFAVSTLGQGKVTFSGSAEFLWTSWDAYNATWGGAVGGTSASPTIVYGALELTCVHTVNAAWILTIYVPKVAFRVGNVTPNADGSALVLPVTLEIAKPTSGDHVVPILINGQSTSYSSL